ncbi:hypothetical protein ACFFGT_07370 [Mucilaginibacter angelicae]|uniref:Uncharacterized protein n=1 Tax=Mucilaginibacter angelicae TaxID=869718 RepID=A0ABV6L3H0_9SPHI
MKKRPVYLIFNIIYQLITCYCLLFANAFLNDFFVPQRLIHTRNGTALVKASSSVYAIIRTLALLGEAAIIILLIYVVNQLILSDTEDKATRLLVAGKTAKVNIGVTLCLLLVLIWAQF